MPERLLSGYDVVVVGGGPGGVGAAVKAGRAGARTLLLEREGWLGGAATTMLVHPFMPHTTDPSPDAPAGRPQVVNAGLFREVAQRLFVRGAGALGSWKDAVHFDDEILKVVLDELVGEAGVEVCFHAALYDVEVEDSRVRAVRLAHNGGPLCAEGTVVIDATGDALLACLAGASCRVGNDAGEVMPMTTNFVVGGVETDRLPGGKELHEAVRQGGSDDPPLINTNLSCYTVRPGGRVHFNAIRISGDTLDPMSLSRAEAEGRRRAENFVAWLRTKWPAFAGAYLAKTGPHIGIRESRRVLGDYELTEEDFHRCARFDDAVACCSYQIDVHGQQPNQTRLESLPPGQYYQIPYRCLTPRGLENVLMASRAISCDATVFSSMRIMPTVMNLGEAAGHAAAMSLPSGDVRGIDVAELQRAIRRAGGVLQVGEQPAFGP